MIPCCSPPQFPSRPDAPPPSKYVIPCSFLLDPPYSWAASRTWPYPRFPWKFETESRAPGTGLIWGPQTCPPVTRPPRPPCPPPCRPPFPPCPPFPPGWWCFGGLFSPHVEHWSRAHG